MAGPKFRRLYIYWAVLLRHPIPKQTRPKHEYEAVLVYCEVEEEFFTTVPTKFIGKAWMLYRGNSAREMRIDI